ncbi:MAG: lipoyl(octanoyl) transferase LipB [Sedimentisphaerales bacterium]|nr:lipoyl(octanoyl) transferase LipB [Sedimentisphaerales bacterium]
MAKKVQQSDQLVIRDCGLAGYGQILSVQQELLAARQEDSVPNTILVVEHHPVITLGARKSENKLRVDEAALRAKGIEIITIGRGGGTTAHNPGQLVIYPIVKLKSLKIDVTEFVRQIEQLGLELLSQLGVTADRKKGLPGLWVGDDKIASVGVQIKKWVTMHGIAINIQNDLSIFDSIVPCGLDGVTMTSAARLTGRQYDMNMIHQAAAQLCLNFFSEEP